ncbi:MAG: penicillin acylase family protein [Acidobacteria bacterium]|nr:penicillin acylase family protein [Acidobacteriota bacterium]
MAAIGVAAALAAVSAAARQAPAEDASFLTARSVAALAQTSGSVDVAGLEQPVEVIRDTWGVPHIYAKSEHDLFFAQGYVAAQDRLWQIDLWRRIADGTLAEVVGPSAVKRDTFARLLKYRGDMQAEWGSYGPGARAIVEAFVAGVNAQIAFVNQHPETLPIEFQLLDARPVPWTPEVVIGRMAGYVMTRNARSEVQRARLARSEGIENVAALMPVDPATPIALPDGLDLNDIVEGVLDIASDASETVRFPDQLAKAASRMTAPGPALLARPTAVAESTEGGSPDLDEPWADVAWRNGSNNWVLAGTMTASGKPILANDPHRVIALPSLRHTVHLVGPGWNVIGAGESALPGVAAGHNDRVAFGFTIVGIDQQDLYVERLDPAAPDHYLYKGVSEAMTVERQSIRVRGEATPRTVELRVTRHGPVVHLDAGRQRAYVLRWVGTEPGTAGYLRSLELNRARNWAEFRAAAAGWKVPSENLVYADVDGNIGWIAAGLAPVRPNWNGLLPVPGQEGKYEWSGFLSIDDLPQAFNPASGYIATANHNILPAGYTKVLQYEWSAPYRYRRIDEVLREAKAAGRKLTVADSERLQHDATSLVARAVCDALRQARDARTQAGTLDEAHGFTRRRLGAIDRMIGWDQVLDADSFNAAIYSLWMPRLSAAAGTLLPAVTGGPRAGQSVSNEQLLGLFARAGSDPPVQDVLLGQAIDEAWREAARLMGPDQSTWTYGRIHRAYWEHPLASTPARRDVFNLPDVPRGGDATAPFATGTGPSQTHGASFREVIDLADWDRSTTINVPGESGQPRSPFYGNLLPLWAAGQYHPMLFSRQAVEANASARLVMRPAAR